jgi:hypothetical protein
VIKRGLVQTVIVVDPQSDVPVIPIFMSVVCSHDVLPLLMVGGGWWIGNFLNFRQLSEFLLIKAEIATLFVGHAFIAETPEVTVLV